MCLLLDSNDNDHLRCTSKLMAKIPQAFKPKVPIADSLLAKGAKIPQAFKPKVILAPLIRAVDWAADIGKRQSLVPHRGCQRNSFHQPALLPRRQLGPPK